MFDVLGSGEENANKPYKAIVTQVYDQTGDGGVDMLDVAELFKTGVNELVELTGDGDFRSEECIELLKQADIVVTNPPFSLFREYVALLLSYNKSFIMVGNKNAVTYKEFFPLLMENKVWVGFRNMNQDFWLYVPEGAPYEKVDENDRHIKHIMACWYTNLDIRKRHEELILVKRYDPDVYLHYVNYDAINVDKVADIPCDYAGVMGVPITFMEKYNPDQFEILGTSDNGIVPDEYKTTPGLSKEFVDDYYKAGGKGSYKEGNPTAGVYKNGIASMVYKRIFIRNKHPEEVKK